MSTQRIILNLDSELPQCDRLRDQMLLGALSVSVNDKLFDAKRGALHERPIGPNWCGFCRRPLISMQFPTCNCGIPMFTGPIAACADESSRHYVSLERIIDYSFGDTFCDFHNYFTLIIEPGQLSKWQSPNQACSRGVFHTEAKAHEWALQRLNGASYTVRFVDMCEDVA